MWGLLGHVSVSTHRELRVPAKGVTGSCDLPNVCWEPD